MKNISIFLLLLFSISFIFAQTPPQKFNYQAVARNGQGVVLPNQSISIRLSILDGSATGTTVYSEIHSATTNSLGLFTLAVGGGTIVSGTFTGIGWGGSSKFLKVDLDPTGGTNYITMGTSQFLSVPYALVSERATNMSLDALSNVSVPTPTNGQVLQWNGTSWVAATVSSGATYTAGTGISITGTTLNSVWTTSGTNIYNNNTGVVGIGTTTPAATAKFSVVSTLDNAGTFETNSIGNAVALAGVYTGTTQVDGIGVMGTSAPQDYYGIGGVFTGGYIGAVGVVQDALNDDYTGLIGSVASSSGSTGVYVGVNGNADAASGIGVGGSFLGTGDASLGTIFGLVAEVNATNSPTLTAYTDVGAPGAYLLGNAGRGGYAANTGAYLFGANTIGTGFFGMSNPTSGAAYSLGLVGHGENGTTASTGAELYGVSAAGTYGLGLYATASGGTTNYAAYLDGDVSVNGNLSKTGGTFKIDHPQDPSNKYLLHSFVESPDMMNIYNGNVVTDANGMATVTLPTYFEALNMDFRYQLTTIGTFAQAIVANEVQSNQFTIQTEKPNVKVSWQVTGVRKDAWANAHRVVPETDKVGAEKGRYLHPELFGLGRNASIGELFSSAKGELKPSIPTKLNLPSGIRKKK